MADSPISCYEIIAREVDGSGVVTVTTTTNITFFNVTGLLPGTIYELTVVAIYEDGNITTKSPESDSVVMGVTSSGISMHTLHVHHEIQRVHLYTYYLNHIYSLLNYLQQTKVL